MLSDTTSAQSSNEDSTDNARVRRLLDVIGKSDWKNPGRRSLADLKLGETATVKCVACLDAELRNKLLSMGLVDGAEVRVVNIAPLGDPITIAVLGFQLSLRRSEADAVTLLASEIAELPSLSPAA